MTPQLETPDDDPFADFDSSDEQPPARARARPNRYEIALWVAAVVLVVVGSGAAWWAAGSQMSFQGSPAGSSLFILIQMTYQLSPAAVTAGLVAAVVALAVRAFALHAARHPAPTVAPEPSQTGSLDSDESAPTVGDVAPAAIDAKDLTRFDLPRRSARRATDHSPFMRPRGD